MGESGSGKSTLARCLTLLERPDRGRIRLLSRELTTLPRRELAAARRQMQLIFQDSAQALNPRFSARQVVEEPLRIVGRHSQLELRRRVDEAVEAVGLPRPRLEDSPLALSGGQRQRLALARALTLEPRVLILDEALSGLDLSVQAQIVNLLVRLQEEHGLSYLFISHDLALAAHLAHRVSVMLEGQIVERGETDRIFSRAQHPYTRALLDSAAYRSRLSAAGPRD